MGEIKLSIAIPYQARLDNLRVVFDALARQTMRREEFEVVVGAMEYSDEYVALCREVTDRLDVVSVLTADPFHIPHARNLAMRQARGEVVVQMDADTLLPPDALRNLWDRHFAFGQDVCVVGQVVGYGNNDDGDVESVEVQPYDVYVPHLDDLVASCAESRDPRFQVPHVIPWAFAWTGLIALRMDTVRRHHLYFDESFRGWGVDDLEWGYRVCASRTPIVLRPDVCAIHLPHVRDSAANRVTEAANYRRFLRKWPGPDVELAHAIGDVEANACYLGFLAALRSIAGTGGSVGSVRGRVKGRDVVVTGVLLDPGGAVADADLLAEFDGGVDVLPLAGLALPYDDGTVDECRLLPSLAGLPARYREAAHLEAERVAKVVVVVPAG